MRDLRDVVDRDARALVLVIGVHRYVYRWRKGQEGQLLCTLLRATRGPQPTLQWSTLLPILVRLRDMVKDDAPAVLTFTSTAHA